MIKILKIVSRVFTRRLTKRAKRLITVTKALKKWLQILLELKTYATASITLIFYLFPLDLDLTMTTCLDTGCRIIFIDKIWLLSYLLHQKISTISTLLNVRGIGTSKHKSAQFAALLLYFLGEDQAGQQVYTSIKWKLYLVNSLRANILVGNDILSLEGFVININKNRALIESCGVTIPINIKQCGEFLRRKFLVENDRLVPPRSETIISLLSVPFLDDRDF